MRTQEYGRIREQRIPPVFIETQELKDMNQSPDLLPTTEANELILAAQIESRLRRDVYPCDVIGYQDGYFTVDVEAPLLWEGNLIEKYNGAVEGMAGVKGIRVHIRPESIYGLG